MVSGTYQPDGRTTDPLTVLDTDPRMAMLSSFTGLDANVTWTLFAGYRERPAFEGAGLAGALIRSGHWECSCCCAAKDELSAGIGSGPAFAKAEADEAGDGEGVAESIRLRLRFLNQSSGAFHSGTPPALICSACHW
jgi:hypothetical protein